MQARLSSRSLVGLLAVLLLAPLTALPFAEPVVASPVFDDEELSRQFLQGMAALVKDGDVLTGAMALEQAQTTAGRAVGLPAEAMPPSLATNTPLYDAVVPAVVAVSSIYTCDRCSDWHLGGMGSGWLLSADGLVVTNHHVIERDPGHRLGVMTSDGEVFAITEVVASDPVGDAVVVRIDTKGRKLPFLAIGRAPDCGTAVSVIGHPVGRFYCLNEGVVSRFHRQQPAGWDAHAPRGQGRSDKPVWMSITADYTVGSSGGPVINAAGEVVGMVSRTVTSSQAKPEEGRNRRRPLAGETIVFKDCVSSETLHKLLHGHPKAAPADTAAAAR